MLRVREKPRKGRIVLAGAQFQVRVFGIPTCECGVMLRDGFIGVLSELGRNVESMTYTLFGLRRYATLGGGGKWCRNNVTTRAQVIDSGCE